jgi:hypothetical protein
MSTDDTDLIDAYGAGTSDVGDLMNGGDYPMISTIEAGIQMDSTDRRRVANATVVVENGRSPKRSRDKRELADRAKKRVA